MKCNTALRTFSIIVSILLVLTLVGGVLMYFTDWGKDWSKLAPGNTAAENGGMTLGEADGNGVAVASAKLASVDYAANGVSEQAESAYTLTATVEPDYADPQKFDWNVAFNNAASEWAKGKTVTDYVTVTPSEDGAATAVVACAQAFAEPITVTCAVRGYDLTATCSVDYRQKVEWFDVWFEKYDLDTTGAYDHEYVSDVPIPAGEEVYIPMKWTGGTGNPQYGAPACDPSETGYKLCGEYELSDTYTLALPDVKIDVDFVSTQDDDTEHSYFSDNLYNQGYFLNGYSDLLNPSTFKYCCSFRPPNNFTEENKLYVTEHASAMTESRNTFEAWFTFDMKMMGMANAHYYSSVGGSMGTGYTEEFYWGFACSLVTSNGKGDYEWIENHYRNSLVDDKPPVLWRVEASVQTSDGEVLMEREDSYIMYYWYEFSGVPQGVTVVDGELVF